MNVYDFKDGSRLVFVVENAEAEEEKKIRDLLHSRMCAPLEAVEIKRDTEDTENKEEDALLNESRKQYDQMLEKESTDIPHRAAKAIQEGGDPEFVRYAKIYAGLTSQEEKKALARVLNACFVRRMAGISRQYLSQMTRDDLKAFYNAYSRYIPGLRSAKSTDDAKEIILAHAEHCRDRYVKGNTRK